MDPEPLDVHHGRLWRWYPQQQTIGVFLNVKFHVGFQPKSVPQNFRDDDSCRIMNFHVHVIDHAICHDKWQ